MEVSASRSDARLKPSLPLRCEALGRESPARKVKVLPQPDTPGSPAGLVGRRIRCQHLEKLHPTNGGTPAKAPNLAKH